MYIWVITVIAICSDRKVQASVVAHMLVYYVSVGLHNYRTFQNFILIQL